MVSRDIGEIPSPQSSSSSNRDERSREGGRKRMYLPKADGQKVKRSKTFTGCFTCRSRKIRCDLQRPYCKKCRKSGLICSGYNIKLRWSRPVQFDTSSGNATSSSVSFKKSPKENDDDEDTRGNTFFQRRRVEFVRWNTKNNQGPYSTYAEIDKDLAVLANSASHNVQYETETRGPFGVFKRDSSQQLQTGLIAKDNNFDSLFSKWGGDSSYIGETTAQDQLWLSNELRDDALLTAAALNGDTQFLDFMTDLSPSTVTSGTESNRKVNNDSGNFNIGRNPTDFLNLVFHGHASQLHNTMFDPDSSHIGEQNTNNMSMANILNTNNPHNVILDPSRNNEEDIDNTSPLNSSRDNDNLEIHLHASLFKSGGSSDTGSQESNNSIKMPASIMSIVKSKLPIRPGIDLSIPNKIPNGPKMSVPVTALQVQPLTRYLLNYYVSSVADLMTVIPLTENPWKTIYFPKALIAIGELSALGKTSNAKNALLNALLAVSAFNLQSKFMRNSESMKFYLNLGIRLRNQATLFIKRLLGPNTDIQAGIEHCISNEKYKDVLCAVMSMISVDLVWGTTQDTNFYIKWCGRVIATKIRLKSKFSPKARVLHRIFSSLKMLQDSTCLDVENVKDHFRSLSGFGYDVMKDKFTNVKNSENSTDERGTINFIINNLTPKETKENKTTSPVFVNKKLVNTRKNDENFATDALFGLPNSLIVIFSETVNLLRLKRYYESQKTLPDNFESRVQELCTRLLDWKLDWKLYKKQGDNSKEPSGGNKNQGTGLEFLSSMHKATYHHILSFYYALCIYYRRFIKGEKPSAVQDEVQNTLHHLNSIQDLIASDKADIIPLFWQGFMAGCEAVSSELQMGFKKWGSDIAQYLGSYWGARQIMLEVWRRKRSNEDRDDWISVIQDWEMNLMLD